MSDIPVPCQNVREHRITCKASLNDSQIRPPHYARVSEVSAEDACKYVFRYWQTFLLHTHRHRVALLFCPSAWQLDRIGLHLSEQPVTTSLLRDPIKEISCISRYDNSKLLANTTVELLANVTVQLFFTAQRFISRAIGSSHLWRQALGIISQAQSSTLLCRHFEVYMIKCYWINQHIASLLVFWQHYILDNRCPAH